MISIEWNNPPTRTHDHAMKFLCLLILAGLGLTFLCGGIVMLGFFWSEQAALQSAADSWRPIARLGLAFTSISLGVIFGGALLRVRGSSWSS